MPSSRFATALRGTTWTVVGYGASQVLRLASTLILARYLLEPDAFGLVALVNVFLIGLDMFSDLGIEPNVIHHQRGDEAAFVNTAFCIQAARGLVLCAVAMALAHPFAAFYKQPAVTTLIVAGALSVAVRGFASGAIWTLKRHVQLRQISLLSIGSEVFGFAVSVVWAYVSPTAWALVARTIASALVYTIGSHLVTTHRVRLQWDRTAAKDILVFGSGIFVATMTYFLAGQAERLILGKFATPAELGCFSLALTMATLPTGAVSQLSGQVFFPIISRTARENPVRMVEQYRKARLLFLGVGIVFGVAFIAYSHRLVTLLLPPRFAMTSWILQFLGVRAALEIFYCPTSSFILACGQPKYFAISNTIRLALVFVGVWLAFSKFGLREAVTVLAFAPAVAYLAFLVGIARNGRSALASEVWGFGLLLCSLFLATLVRWPWA